MYNQLMFEGSHIEQKKSLEQIDPQIIEDGIKLAMQYIESLNYWNSQNENHDPNEVLSYHNVDHTKSVIERYMRIVSLIREIDPNLISIREIQIGQLGSAFHDDVQNFVEKVEIEKDTINGMPNPFAGMEKKIRARDTINNEEESYKPAIAYMREVNKTKPNTFTKIDEDMLHQQIAVTVPDFDIENKTVFQPNLNKDSKIVDIALALADINGAGIDGAEQFINEGNALFREENLDIMEAVFDMRNGQIIPEKNKEYFKHRIILWSQIQPAFAQGRKNLLDKEISILSPAIQTALKDKIFNKFDESIDATKKLLDERKSMSFEEIIASMGYKI